MLLLKFIQAYFKNTVTNVTQLTDYVLNKHDERHENQNS